MSWGTRAGGALAFRAVVWPALSWLAVLAPFLLFAVLLPRFGELQRNDYWGDFQQVVQGDRLKPAPLAWLGAKSNEHRITLPLLVWAANVQRSGDLRLQPLAMAPRQHQDRLALCE